MLVLFNNLKNKDKKKAVDHLVVGSTPSQDFFLMVILSILTATFGLLINNTAVIIGSMLIAPILYPILSLSLGIIMSDSKLTQRSLYTIFKSIILGVITAALATLLFASHYTQLTPEIVSRTEASLPYIAIAISAGFAGTFALVKPQLNETLPGIAISVALIPPIAVMGIGLARFDWEIISGSLLLFLVNAVGVVFASMMTFSLMNFYLQKNEARKKVAEEDEKEAIERRELESKQEEKKISF